MINKRRGNFSGTIIDVGKKRDLLSHEYDREKNLRNQAKNGSSSDVNYNLIYWHFFCSQDIAAFEGY
jgi:hypothetical protein